MYLNYEPVIPLQVTYPREVNIYAHTKTHGVHSTSIYNSHKCKQPKCPSMGECTMGRVAYPSIQQITTQNQSNKLLTSSLNESQKIYLVEEDTKD